MNDHIVKMQVQKEENSFRSLNMCLLLRVKQPFFPILLSSPSPILFEMSAKMVHGCHHVEKSHHDYLERLRVAYVHK